MRASTWPQVGASDEVVGNDLQELAAAWAAERRAPPPPAVRSLRAVTGPATTAATYAVMAHAVEWARSDPGVLLIRLSDLVWLAVLVCASVLLTRQGTLRRLVMTRRRAPALLASLALFVGPIVVPLVARTAGAFGAVLFGWPWWASLLVAVTAVVSVIASKTALHEGPKMTDSGG